MRYLPSLLLCSALLLGCASTDGAPDPVADQIRAVESSSGKLLLRYAPAPDPIPLNESFELELNLVEVDGGAPVEGAQLFVRGWMPDHNHGMFREPVVTDLGGGRYRAVGMLFHMPGHWQILVDLVVGGIAEKAGFDVVL